jgi:putative transposase
MARPLRIKFPGAFYYVTCWGIEHREIFTDDLDCYNFLDLLSHSLASYQVVLYAYIMMTNHFHLLIQTRKANCSEFMRHFNICYTRWFNNRHSRRGNLYQGRFKAFLIDADNYLPEVSSYLHLNSVRVKELQSVNYLQRWQYARRYHWSSLSGYLDEKRTLKFIDYNFILMIIGDRGAYRRYVFRGLQRDISSPFKKIRSGIILGDTDFIAKVKRFLRRGSMREQPPYRDLVTSTIDPEVVMAIIMAEFEIGKDSLRQRRAHGEIRGIAAELLYKYCDITQAQIGRHLGDIDYVSVCQLRRRLRERMSENSALRKRYTEAEAKVKAACIM